MRYQNSYSLFSDAVQILCFALAGIALMTGAFAQTQTATPNGSVSSAELERQREEELRHRQRQEANRRLATLRNSPTKENKVIWVVKSEDELTRKEKKLLEPRAEDRQTYQDFLRQPDTGIFKLLSDERSGTVAVASDNATPLPLLGGGAYYSFSKKKHDANEHAEIRLRNGVLQIGFAPQCLAVMTMVGDVELSIFNPNSPGVAALSAYLPPADLTGAKQHHLRNENGFEMDGFIYKSELPVVLNNVYALRTTAYGRADQLVLFRIVRQERDGSVTIVWKKLKRYPAPAIKKTNR